DRDRDGRVDARELLDRERVGERVGAGAAVLLRERDAHQAELAELRDDRVRERLRAVELARLGCDLALRDVADGRAKSLVLFGKVEDHEGTVPKCGSLPAWPKPTQAASPRRAGSRTTCVGSTSSRACDSTATTSSGPGRWTSSRRSGRRSG